MNVSVRSKVVVAVLVAGALAACSSDPPANKESPRQTSVVQETYKPTGSHIRERTDGRRSPKNSSNGPVQDLKNAPAVTVIQNQPPK